MPCRGVVARDPGVTEIRSKEQALATGEKPSKDSLASRQGKIRRWLYIAGLLLASVAVMVALQISSNASSQKYRDATALIEDNRERCEEMAANVLSAWHASPDESSAAVERYFLGSGRYELAAARLRTEQIRDLLRDAKHEGTVRDLVLALHTSVAKLCDLASSPAGYSQLTFNERRSALRDEIATCLEKLRILLPISDRERAQTKERFAPALAAEFNTIAQERLAAEKRVREAQAAQALTLQAQQQAESERLAADMTERRERDRAWEEERRKRDDELHQRQSRMAPAVKTWYQTRYPDLMRFGTVGQQVERDIARPQQRAAECSLLRDIGERMLARGVYRAPDPELAAIAERVVQSFRAGAIRCLQGSDLEAARDFADGDQSMRALAAGLATYGLRQE
jgi:hypothetical protein